jgi:hypothetical protein
LLNMQAIMAIKIHMAIANSLVDKLSKILSIDIMYSEINCQLPGVSYNST